MASRSAERWLGLAIAVALIAAALAAASCRRPAQSRSCGQKPDDWCASPAGDPCGRHRDEASCRADAACRGLPYSGESVVACHPDGKGFWDNCPAVGCVSR